MPETRQKRRNAPVTRNRKKMAPGRVDGLKGNETARIELLKSDQTRRAQADKDQGKRQTRGRRDMWKSVNDRYP